MARVGWDVLAVSLDNAAGTPTDISAYVTEEFDFDRGNVTQEVTAAGDDDEAHAPVGLKNVKPIVLKGPMSDEAGSLTTIGRGILGLIASSTLLITWTSGKTSSVECFETDFKRSAGKGRFTQTEVTLQPTGAVTEV